MTLADDQAALVRALVAGGPPPVGIDPARLDAAALALRRKRADEVARVWPALMSDPATRTRFIEWAHERPKTTSFDDGMAFAIEQRGRFGLSPAAGDELRRARRRRYFRRR